MLFAFQTGNPTGGYLVWLIAKLLSETKAPFFDLAQWQLPSLPNCPETFTDPYGHGLSPPQELIFLHNGAQSLQFQ
jgi:hypothetical protein